MSESIIAEELKVASYKLQAIENLSKDMEMRICTIQRNLISNNYKQYANKVWDEGFMEGLKTAKRVIKEFTTHE